MRSLRGTVARRQNLGFARFSSEEKTSVAKVDEQVAQVLTSATEGIKGATTLGSQMASMAGSASRAVVAEVGEAVKAVVPETDADVPQGVRSVTETARHAAEFGHEVVAGIVGAAGAAARVVGERVGNVVREAIGDAGPSPSYRTVEAGKEIAKQVGSSASELMDRYQKEKGAIMDEARSQTRQVLSKAAGPTTVAAADDLMVAIKGTKEVASKAAGGLPKDMAKEAAKEAARGAAQLKD